MTVRRAAEEMRRVRLGVLRIVLAGPEETHGTARRDGPAAPPCPGEPAVAAEGRVPDVALAARAGMTETLPDHPSVTLVVTAVAP